MTEEKLESSVSVSSLVNLDVYIALTIYEVGNFDIETSSVPVSFDLWLLYNRDNYNNIFTTRNALPWIMPNALELNVAAHSQYNIKGPNNPMNYQFNMFALQTDKMIKNNSYNTTYNVEVYTIRGVLKVVAFYGQDPFQSLFFVMKLAMDGTPGSEVTNFIVMSDLCYFPGCRRIISNFKQCETTIRKVSIETNYGSYSRIYFIFEYVKSPLQDIGKYYILPALINILTIGFYKNVDSLFDSAGTYFLAIIALLFTVPTTGTFTRNEKSIVFNSLFMLIILVTLNVIDSDKAQIFLWIIFGLCFCCLLLYDYIISTKINNKIKKQLFVGDISTLDVI